jgi:phosphoadenosine phosphosulfate reductase
MPSAFGMNGVALIHIVHEIARDANVPIIFVDTGYLFPETLETKRQIEATYGCQIVTYHPLLSVEEQTVQYGPSLPTRDPDLCCLLRKVEPMQRALIERQPAAILNGRACFQSPSRRTLKVVEWERDPIRIHPLVYWTEKQIVDFIKSHHIPYNPLHDRGYRSIGCQPCTRPVTPGEHIRAGRWPGTNKSECGLWTTTYTSERYGVPVQAASATSFHLQRDP